MADRIGTEIASYRIEALIARGGMGEVYLATQAFPERKVALKIRLEKLTLMSSWPWTRTCTEPGGY